MLYRFEAELRQEWSQDVGCHGAFATKRRHGERFPFHRYPVAESFAIGFAVIEIIIEPFIPPIGESIRWGGLHRKHARYRRGTKTRGNIQDREGISRLHIFQPTDRKSASWFSGKTRDHQ